MNDFDKKISDNLKGYLNKNIDFSNEESEKIHLKIQQGNPKSRKFNPVYWTVLASAAIIFLILNLSFLKKPIGPDNEHAVVGSGDENFTLPEFEQYIGDHLSIGVIGNPPDVIEKELVNFKPFTFDELLNGSLEYVDAIFIMKENLNEAAESKYAKVYLESRVPFFFIESSKGVVPFIYEKVSYEKYPDLSSDNAAAGYIPSESGDTSGLQMSFGLYNDIQNKETIANLYSQIFEEIQKFKFKNNDPNNQLVETIINQHNHYIKLKMWDEYVDLFDYTSDREPLLSFLKDSQNQSTKEGIHGVQNIELVSMQLSSDPEFNSKGDYVYDVFLEMKVHKDSDFYMNGVTHHIFVFNKTNEGLIIETVYFSGLVEDK